MTNNRTIKERNLKNMKGKTICRFPSYKQSPHTVYTESETETDFCYHLEADPQVIEFISQPKGFYYWIGPERHIYTPDFLVHYKNAPSKYFEIKVVQFLPDDFWEQFPIIQKQSLLEGFELDLVTDEFIYKEPLYQNLKHLHRARKNGFCSDEFRRIAIFALSNVQELTIRELLDYAEKPDAIGMVYKLIQEKELFFDINISPLGPNCLVRKFND
jgi:hypothetical protein